MTDTTIKVAAIPLDIKFCDPEANILTVSGMISAPNSESADIYVLPELFSTGFISDPEMILKYAETVDGPTMTAIYYLAKKHNAAFAGSFICRIDNHCYNRAFFITPDGDVTFYDKRHLFSISPESKVLTGGRERCPIVRFRGWNVAMVICYDIRFPVWCRNVGQLYEILLVPANWPSARSYAWEHLLIGRAIENQAYVVGANRSGLDDYGDYTGLSFIMDPYGKPIGEVDTSTGIVSATFDRDCLAELRRRLPVDRDAENFNIADL